MHDLTASTVLINVVQPKLNILERTQCLAECEMRRGWPRKAAKFRGTTEVYEERLELDGSEQSCNPIRWFVKLGYLASGATTSQHLIY
jgi:hypothetical protein